MPKPIIGYAGLTHLGLNSAMAAAEKGFNVFGYHNNTEYVASINRGILPIMEPKLGKLIRKYRERLKFSADINSLAACDIVYISIDVPTDFRGKSNLAPIEKMANSIGKILRPDALLIILCQVPPGFTHQIPRRSQYLYYQVETLIFGRAVERAIKPERIIIGCANPDKAIDPRLKNFLGSFGCPILPMRYESAELAKISINMCLIASISVANTMAEICEHIGANWSEIVPSLRLDARIGEFSYLKPGLGIAGGNLERDLNTVLQLTKEYKTDESVVKAYKKNSNHRKNWVLKMLKSKVFSKKSNPQIGLLGLAYKENTQSTKNSPSITLLKHLKGFQVLVHDPVVPADVIDSKFSFVTRAEDVANNADALIVMTPWPEYAKLDLKEIFSRMAGNAVLDPYRIFDQKIAKAVGFDYLTLGYSKPKNA